MKDKIQKVAKEKTSKKAGVSVATVAYGGCFKLDDLVCIGSLAQAGLESFKMVIQYKQAKGLDKKKLAAGIKSAEPILKKFMKIVNAGQKLADKNAKEKAAPQKTAKKTTDTKKKGTK